MKLLLKLAWRNIWRNKRRSVLTLLAIVFAVFLSITMRGIQKGIYELSIKTALDTFPGYLQLQAEGFKENNSIKHNFKLTNKIKNDLENIKQISGYAERVQAAGLISYKENSQGTAILGVSPELEKNVSTLLEKINQGRFFDSDTSLEIVLGSTLLEKLNATVGENVVLLAQGFDGSMGNLKFKIIGTVKLGVPELDAMAAFIPLTTAQELVSLYNRINVAAIKIDDLKNVNSVEKTLEEKITDEKIAILPWNNVVPDLKQSIDLDNISGIFMLIILVIIVSFGILNTILMSVTERFNEFGVCLAVGMPNSKLVLTIIFETLLIIFVGLLIGNVFSYGLVSYLNSNPVIISGEYAEMYELYGFVPKIQPSLNISTFINPTIVILLTSLVTAIYPITKVIKLEALKGIRYT